MMDSYFNRNEVSNSDLGALEKMFMSREQVGDIEAAYRFGTLVDAVITEPEKVDHYKYTVSGEQYTCEEFAKAGEMAKAFMADDMCRQIMKHAVFQTVMAKTMQYEHRGVPFTLNVRCKWDLWMELLEWGGDIKSTAAASQKAFEQSIEYFNYDRQRAWYMDIAGSKRDMLIGISKVNNKIFKVPITRDSDLYKRGREKYLELAFKHWCLFDNF